MEEERAPGTKQGAGEAQRDCSQKGTLYLPGCSQRGAAYPRGWGLLWQEGIGKRKMGLLSKPSLTWQFCCTAGQDGAEGSFSLQDPSRAWDCRAGLGSSLAAPQQPRLLQPRFRSCKHPGRATARGRDVGHGVPPLWLGGGTGNKHPACSHLGRQHPGLKNQSLLQNQSLRSGDEAAARQPLEQAQAPTIPGRARTLPFAPRSRISRCLGSSPQGLTAPLLPPGPCGNLSSQETLAGGKGG